MGLLSFLKRENDRLRTPLKGRAYHTTVPAQPPVKGTYPIAGNKPPVRKHVPRRIDTNEPSSPVTGTATRGQFERHTDHTSAPSDLRPSTAQTALLRPGSGYQRPASWFKRDYSRPSSASLRKPSLVDTPLRSFAGPAAPTQTADDEIFFEPNPVVTPLRPPTSHSQASRAAPAHVDLLDAQEQFKHADFRSRIAAAGARDYGEDVADRNIALNSGSPSHYARPSMSSLRSSSYYSVATGDGPPHLRRLVASAEATRSLTLLHSRNATEAAQEESARSPTAGGYARLRPATSATLMPFPTRGDGFGLRDAGTTITSRSRGTSISTYEEFPSDNQVRERRPRQRRMTYAASSNDLAASTHASQASLSRGDSSDGKTMRARSRSCHRSDDASDSAFFESEPPLPPALSMNPVTRRQRPKSRIRADTGSSEESSSRAADPASSLPPPILAGASSMTMSDYGRRAPFYGDSGDHDGPDWANGYRLGHIDVESGGDDASEVWSAAPAPSVRRGDRTDSLYSHDRAHSLVSSRGGGDGGGTRSRLGEIVEAVPIRRSSLRHWSISSTTPTTSSVSSNPFPRPHSRHTAQTSVDDFPRSPAFPTSGASPAPGEKGYVAGPGPLTWASAPVFGPDSFNLDDYVSSSDDEFVDGARHPRSPDGESLLFNDSGYGFRGVQLPGLFDTILELPSEDPAAALQPPSPSRIFHCRSLGRRSSIRSTHSTESMYSAKSRCLSESRPPSPRARPASRAMSQDDSGECEGIPVLARSFRDEKAGVTAGDLKMTVRMRRESKARARMRSRDLGQVE